MGLSRYSSMIPLAMMADGSAGNDSVGGGRWLTSGRGCLGRHVRSRSSGMHKASLLRPGDHRGSLGGDPARGRGRRRRGRACVMASADVGDARESMVRSLERKRWSGVGDEESVIPSPSTRERMDSERILAAVPVAGLYESRVCGDSRSMLWRPRRLCRATKKKVATTVVLIVSIGTASCDGAQVDVRDGGFAGLAAAGGRGRTVGGQGCGYEVVVPVEVRTRAKSTVQEAGTQVPSVDGSFDKLVGVRRVGSWE